jgi:hypothetical protein
VALWVRTWASEATQAGVGRMTSIRGLVRGINSSLERQTEILSKFLSYQQKQDHLEEKVKGLEKEYLGTKESLTDEMGWLRGAFTVGTFCISIVMGMSVFVVKEKLSLLQSVSERINKIELVLTGGAGH